MSAYRSGRVSLRFELSAEELSSATQRNRVYRRADLAAASVTFLCTAMYVMHWGAAGLVGGLALSVVVAVFQRWLVRQSRGNGRAEEKLRQCEVEAGDERFVQIAGGARASLSWSCLAGWDEVATAFRIYSEPNAAVFVPKRAFTGVDAERTFRQLLCTHLGRPGAPAESNTVRAAVWVPFAAYCTFVVLFFGALFEALISVFMPAVFG